MSAQTILITGATDGIGRATAKALVKAGHQVLIHGRSADKLAATRDELGLPQSATYAADLSDMREVTSLAQRVAADHPRLDVLINNAGVYTVAAPRTDDGLDVRFVVNTLAPYVLTRALLPQLDERARVVNLSSAAQAPVDLQALAGARALTDSDAYAQSKLALTAWSRHLAEQPDAPIVLAVNPGSMLATKMVAKAYGVAGADVSRGAEVLSRAALDPAFAERSGSYFDNDHGRFAAPHPDALDPAKTRALIAALDALAERLMT